MRLSWNAFMRWLGILVEASFEVVLGILKNKVNNIELSLEQRAKKQDVFTLDPPRKVYAAAFRPCSHPLK